MPCLKALIREERLGRDSFLKEASAVVGVTLQSGMVPSGLSALHQEPTTTFVPSIRSRQIVVMTTLEHSPLLPQDLDDGTASTSLEHELVRPEGITEVKAPRAPARSSLQNYITSSTN